MTSSEAQQDKCTNMSKGKFLQSMDEKPTLPHSLLPSHKALHCLISDGNTCNLTLTRNKLEL